MANYTDVYLAPGFVTATSAVPDWDNSISYGTDELVADGYSGIQYRAVGAHTSPATGNLTDDLGNWEVIGSASGGVVVEEWTDEVAAISDFTSLGTVTLSGASYLRHRREGDSLRIQAHYQFSGSGTGGTIYWNFGIKRHFLWD